MAFSKCNCTACSGHIEFETSNVGNIITCPHCNLETVLYEVKATPVARLAPHQPSRQEEPPTISRFESVVFGVTRFFVLGLSGFVVIALGLLVLTFASTLLKERKDRVVSYEEVSTSLIPTSHQSAQASPSTTAKGVKIPQSVQEALPKNGEALERLQIGRAHV